MNLERLLSLATALLVLMGTFLLGMGKQNLYLPLLMLPVVIVTVFFVDQQRLFRLNQHVANWVALAAAVYAFTQFFRMSSGSRLYPISDLLVYLEIVLLLQVKSNRVHAHLIMLSMLQVVVAAALDVNIWCGMVILAYLVLMLVTVTMLYVARNSERYAKLESNAGRGPAAGPLIYTSDRSAAPWGKSAAWGVATHTMAMVVFTLLLTLLVFYLVPRRDTPGSGLLTPRISVVGFSEEVSLGELEGVTEDPEVVMNVQFLDARTGEPFEATSGPLMRGTVLSRYDPVRREWKQTDWKANRATGLSSRPLQGAVLDNDVHQKIMLEPIRQRVVFSVYPPVSVDQNVIYDSDNMRLMRRQSRRMSFTIGTLGFDGHQQAQVIPQTEVLTASARQLTGDLTDGLETRLREYLDECRLIRNFPGVASLFPGLTALAQQVVQEANVPRLEGAADEEPLYDPVLAARAIEDYLRFGGGFVYALEGRSIPNGVDPIEHFVMEHRRGHCEYFASAMVMMLRSLNIPARMVVGFRAEEWNSFGRFYVVRQLHAHTWVEAFLTPQDIRGHNLSVAQVPFGTGDPDPDSLTLGGWMLLDPTAAATGQGNRYAASLFGRFREVGDYMQNGWTNWVLGMDADRQREAIYEPLQERLRVSYQIVFGAEALGEKVYRIYAAVRDGISAWIGGEWFSWRGGLVAMAICFVLLGLLALARLFWKSLVRLAGRAQLGPAASQASRVAFNDRFVRLLARHGFSRGPSQTSLEFAQAVGYQLAESPLSREASATPRRIVDAYYQVRFGGRALDNHQQATVERALAELEAALAKRSRPETKA